MTSRLKRIENAADELGFDLVPEADKFILRPRNGYHPAISKPYFRFTLEQVEKNLAILLHNKD